MIRHRLFPPLIVVLPGCLGPNPLLEECGEKWVIEANDAWKKDENEPYWTRVCAEWNYPNCIYARGEMCLNVEQANDLLTNANSLILEALRLKAISACKQIAVDSGAEFDTCAQGLGEPFYEGRCPLTAEQCVAGSTESGSDDDATGETDTGGFVGESGIDSHDYAASKSTF